MWNRLGFRPQTRDASPILVQATRMLRARPALALLLPLCVAAVAAPTAANPDAGSVTAATAGEWQLTRDEDGIRSYVRASSNSDLLAFKGETTLDAPIDRVLSVVLDADRVGEWIPRIVESTVLRWERGSNEYIQFTRFNAPWPVKDRVFLSRVVLEIDPVTSRTSLRYYNAPEETLPVRDDGPAIHGSAGGSYYLLEPADGGRATRLLAISAADPKGSLPVWLINWAGTSWAHETMSSLRAQVMRSDVHLLPIVRGLYPGRLELTAPPAERTQQGDPVRGADSGD
jgi:hypothetical protein